MENPQEGMILNEKGILHKDGIYIHTPTGFAVNNLFYIRLAAMYTCDAPYRVERKKLNAFLLFYILEGELHFEYRGEKFTAPHGSVVLIDAKDPHVYYARSQVRFYWFHFNGNAAQAYFDRLHETKKPSAIDAPNLEEEFARIHNSMKEDIADDDRISVRIHRILAGLCSPETSGRRYSDPVMKARLFMDTHYREKLSVREIAAHVSLSLYYFSKLFREETEVTPYNYLTGVRLKNAMRMLIETDLTIEQIADICAFCSSANFIRCFRLHTGMTPSQFRKGIAGMTSSEKPDRKR
jgi:AraC family transcriptional regulator